MCINNFQEYTERLGSPYGNCTSEKAAENDFYDGDYSFEVY